MRPSTAVLRSLGNRGAVANVRAVLDARHREDWVVESLLRRIDPPASAPAGEPAATDQRSA